MTAPAPRWDDGFAHPALFYRGTAEYLEGTVAFVNVLVPVCVNRNWLPSGITKVMHLQVPLKKLATFKR